MDPHNIDFDRLAQLLDIVQKQASVAPQYTALGAIAMSEIKEINAEAQDYLNELGQERLREEQEAAAELAEHNRVAAEKQAKDEAGIAARTEASRQQPRTVMPGEPVEPILTDERQPEPTRRV